MNKVSYPKEMRERAKADGKCLVTVAIPGFQFQGPVVKERADELIKLCTKWFKEDKKAEPR